jgi:hypothetical protein
LVNAIESISLGDMSYTDYHNISGMNSMRLGLAQTWRDRGKEYCPKDIIGLSLFDIKSELGFGREMFGVFYRRKPII